MSDNFYDYGIKSEELYNPSFFLNKWRVKLYHLNNNGQWDDMGTGHVSIKKKVSDNYNNYDNDNYYYHYYFLTQSKYSYEYDIVIFPTKFPIK